MTDRLYEIRFAVVCDNWDPDLQRAWISKTMYDHGVRKHHASWVSNDGAVLRHGYRFMIDDAKIEALADALAAHLAIHATGLIAEQVPDINYFEEDPRGEDPH